MNKCLFCQIIKGKIPSYKVYEDKDFLGFLDINPMNPGHILIVPKKHYRWVWQVEKIGKLWQIANTLGLKTMKALNAFTVLFVTAGFEIEHAHVHVVPRFKNDGHGGFIDFKKKKQISKKQMRDIMEKINKI